MASWDVFHADRLEVERALSTEAIRAALARGEVRDDDLVRPAGTTIPWARLADFPALVEPLSDHPAPAAPLAPAPAPAASAPAAPAPETAAVDDEFPPEFADDLDEDDDEDEELVEEEVEEDFDDAPILGTRGSEARVEQPVTGDEEFGAEDLELDDDDSILALPVEAPALDALDEEFDPQEEDEAAAEFTLSRGSAEKVEELDLAAMVDVAFQLVLFFLVTATTVLYKSLEVPKPNPDSPAAGATQGRSRSLDDLKDDYILVEIDPAGSMKIDHEPVAADMTGLVARLRDAREKTGRKAMLLTADFVTPHRNAVLAYDAANEIGLGIAIARPTGSAPEANPPPVPKKAPQG